MPLYNQYGGIAGGMTSERDIRRTGGGMGIPGVMPSGGMMPGGSLYGGGAAAFSIPSAADANAGNLAFTRGAMAGDPTYKAAQGFLNPNDPNAMYDVMKSGAEHAVGGGTVGSGVAGQYTGRLRQYDIERRAALGNQLLSGAYGRTPQPVDPYAQSRIQNEANAENNRLLASIQSRYAPSGGFSQGGGGGGRSAPMVIGAGGTGGVAAPSVRPYLPTGGGVPAGSGSLAYGQGGPDWNAVNQASQFYPGEYAPGTMYSGSVAGAPTQDLSITDDEWANSFM